VCVSKQPKQELVITHVPVENTNAKGALELSAVLVLDKGLHVDRAKSEVVRADLHLDRCEDGESRRETTGVHPATNIPLVHPERAVGGVVEQTVKVDLPAQEHVHGVDGLRQLVEGDGDLAAVEERSTRDEGARDILLLHEHIAARHLVDCLKLLSLVIIQVLICAKKYMREYLGYCSAHQKD
jgi:hypothetical protein